MRWKKISTLAACHSVPNPIMINLSRSLNSLNKLTFHVVCSSSCYGCWQAIKYGCRHVLHPNQHLDLYAVFFFGWQATRSCCCIVTRFITVCIGEKSTLKPFGIAGAAKVTKQMVNGKSVAFQSFIVKMYCRQSKCCSLWMRVRERLDNKEGEKNLKWFTSKW